MDIAEIEPWLSTEWRLPPGSRCGRRARLRILDERISSELTERRATRLERDGLFLALPFGESASQSFDTFAKASSSESEEVRWDPLVRLEALVLADLDNLSSTFTSLESPGVAVSKGSEGSYLRLPLIERQGLRLRLLSIPT